jgi:transcriptional regulator of acetoin/glycerol metabolism
LRTDETDDQSAPPSDADGSPAKPGIVHIFAADAPVFAPRAITAPLVIGRGDDSDVVIDDRRLSRRHAEVRFDLGGWTVTDLDSHNGTFVDTTRVHGSVSVKTEAVLAVGGSLFLLVGDVRAVAGAVVVGEGTVRGPQFAALLDRVASFAKRASILHVVGETGSGKELVARHFHACRAPRGPFIAVNCATIPPLLAERLLFGARKGAYSGAETDTDGYLTAADGGVLFLDEIGELPLDVQAKLLRAIETREVTPLGATKPQPLEIAICTATHVDLRDAVKAGLFREDLYFRIANPSVEVPPLRRRREEIPWFIDLALAGTAVRAHASFVEGALTRPWPGNVRELLAATATAASVVKPPETHLKMTHLGDRVGMWFNGRAEKTPAVAPADPERIAISEALRREQGNVTRAARALGLHRTQLRRWLEKHDIDVGEFKSTDDSSSDS